ncbi:MAG: ATPase, T2SS/T4P/T4SS family [Synergistales bacterium]|nr:ATPase, T2SS/T4P/T4SS family [Synergistales bacterium]MDY6401461.1 ATPase, T2SS/T4P/T4SS family [Synergistales bacterium]MDY6409715.1 ATPase, T2SS/T4P/T4SS family [Synergistales bacterium]MDY6414106.1 ATPase, T2SS/T4P/T4SS family [Synergistales bacterium]MDY6425286.1 ATPase, T2SS/T4P/T4SS family [Synergistales bacterium]
MQDFFLKSRKRFGEILREYDLVTQDQLDNALKIQKTSDKRIGEILVSINAMTRTQVAETLAVQLELQFIQLDRYQAKPDAIKLVPRNIAERLNLIPLQLDDDDTLLITMADPLDLPAQDEIKLLTGHNLRAAVSGSDDISRNLQRIYDFTANMEGILAASDMTDGTEAYTTLSATTVVAGPDDAPLIELVNDMIQQAVKEEASDIHIEAYEQMSRFRFRVDGNLYVHFEYPSSLHPSVISRVKIMSGMDISEKRKPQDGRILTVVDGKHIDLRVSSLPTMSGEKIVMRILDRDHAAVELEQLGFDEDDMEYINKFCEMPWGILLATGPTGSGKSTTLYSMLKRISHPDINIITVEDPVEFYIPGINQVNVNEKAGLTFDSALRSILRQDPDKIMIGEIRDSDTAQIAIRSALTGHFVLSTLHTNDAPSAATRIIDMGIQPFLLSASLSGVIAQRLVRCLCPHCKEEYELDEKTCEKIEVPTGSHAFRPVGCQHCRNGYRGRRGIYEIMFVDDDLREMILKGADNIELREAAIKHGMKTLRRAGINAALHGVTSLEEVLTTTI